MKLVEKMGRSFNKVGFKFKKHSPEILVICGVGGMIVSTVMACKATTKLNDILTESKEQIDEIHDVIDNNKYPEKYNVEDSKKDLTLVYVQTGVKIVKLYAPAVITGTLSIASILTSHKILKSRNIALAAAYATIDKGFKEYRGRVVERFGEKVDKELRYNLKAQEIEKTITDEKGKEKKVKETVENVAADGALPSIYARYFDNNNVNWENDAGYNLTFLRQQEQYANMKLQKKGYLYLNEVYNLLGFPETKEGQIVGWIYNEKHPVGDNYVSFGIYDVNVIGYRNDYAGDTIGEERRDFVNGRLPYILLDFNVDGNIWDMM